MLLKKKILKTLYFIPKAYFMLVDFIADGETKKFTRFMTHGWSIIIICLLGMYLRTLVLHATGIEPLSNIAVVLVVGLLFPIVFALWLKFVVIRFLGRGTFQKPANQDDKTDDKKQ